MLSLLVLVHAISNTSQWTVDTLLSTLVGCSFSSLTVIASLTSPAANAVSRIEGRIYLLTSPSSGVAGHAR